MTKRTDQISIIDYLTDPQLLGLTVSEPQETLLRAGFGLPPGSKSQREIYCLCTGRESWPKHDLKL